MTRLNLEKYPVEIYGPIGSKERREKTQKNIRLENAYGITYLDYLRIFEEQRGLCAICKEPETGIHNRGKSTVDLSLAVDHCHDTGEVRGLLCHKCNKGIGLLGDSEEGLLKALSYLRGE
jgi:hypothetical protein